MVRMILITAVVVLLNVFAGCGGGDFGVESGRSQLLPADVEALLGSGKVAKITTASEADIIEQVATNREAYRQGLEMLVEHYSKTGNNMKLEWAKKELGGLRNVPQYKYILEANVAGPNLKATASIIEADYMYNNGLQLEQKAKSGGLFLFKDEDSLRVALEQYNQLIRKHPTSDKIDDAAYRAGGIYESFKDYSIALLYYQRAYQWDPDTPHPAMFKAAYILDRYLRHMGEALELYQQAVKRGKLSQTYEKYARDRIAKLTEAEEIE